ncbi:uncharacterized protein ACIQIH_003534 [Cyanocitta cristata]
MPAGSRRAGNQARCFPSTVGCRRSGVRPSKGYSPGISLLARSVEKEGNVANKIKHKTKDRTCPTEPPGPTGSAETQEPPASHGLLGCSAAAASGKVSRSPEAAVRRRENEPPHPPGTGRTAPLPQTLRTNPEAPQQKEGGTRGKEPRGGKRDVRGSRCRSGAETPRGGTDIP